MKTKHLVALLLVAMLALPLLSNAQTGGRFKNRSGD